MLVKLGVDISRLNREIRRTLDIVEAVFEEIGEEAVVSSTFEGNHSAGSLHYSNDAYDVKLPKKADRWKVFNSLREKIDKRFDLYYADGYPCFHIEYDPKKTI